MEGFRWLATQWFELVQSAGIVAGLLFTGYRAWQEHRARKLGNLLTIKQHYREIHSELYTRPSLFRVLKKDVNLESEGVSEEERLFVKLLVFHLDTVHRAMKTGLFVTIEGLKRDIQEFFASPIPKAVWDEMKPHQNEEFVRFIEESRLEGGS